MIKIGLIGCGAIGSALARVLEQKFRDVAYLAYVSDLDPEKIRKLAAKIDSPLFHGVSALELIRRSDFIIEAASQEAARTHVPQALKQNKDILILSVGGLLQIPNLSSLLRKSRSRVYVPSGAIAGVDAVVAAKTLGIKKVQITTRKPLGSLAGSPYFRKKKIQFSKIKSPTLVFEGTAREAIHYFPQNINVAATLSLAGVGPEKTRVRIFTSPTYRRNTHEIEMVGKFGRMVSRVMNIPSEDNPKTSSLAIASAIAMLGKIFRRLKIGT